MKLRINFKICVMSLLIMLFSSLSANAATYYVATDGSDSNPGTLAQPWQHIAWATCGGFYGCPVSTNNPNKLKAGDTLYIRGGTYLENKIQFANSGTSTAPIIIKAYPDEKPIIDGGFTTVSAEIIPVFDIGALSGQGSHYINLDGLTIMRGSRVNVRISETMPATYITIKNCDLMNFVAYNNSAQIYVDTASDNITIENNKMHGMQSYDMRASGVIIFKAETLTIRNNEIYSTSNGIYYKHSIDDGKITIVENNLIHDTSDMGIRWSRADGIIRNNIIYNVGTGIRVFEESASCPDLVSKNNQLLHNTIVDAAVGVYIDRSGGFSCEGAVNTVVKDNLIFNFTDSGHRGLSVWPYNSVDSSNTTFDHNLIYSSSFSLPIRVLSNYYNITTIPSTVTGTGNIQQAPIFKNYANRDFALMPNSPGYKAASDGYDMGADTSLPPTPTTGSGNTPPPSNNGSGGDVSASGGGGCGFVKDINGKGPRANGEGLVLMILLIIMLSIIAIAKKAFKRRAASKTRSQLLNFKTGLIGLIVLLIIAAYTPANATVYFYIDAEDGTVGNYVPNPPLCQTECSGGGERATYQSSGGTPQGSKYYQWQTVDNQPEHYTEIHINYPSGVTNIVGRTFYLAYFFRFDRINGLDIWHESGQSGDKGVELVGSGLRWAVGGGHWPSHANNQDHRYNMMAGNATYHLNPELEVQDGYVQNQSGYNANNPLQLQYEHWYSAVMAVKMATDNTGSLTVYIDGIKIYEYNNIKTVATTSATIADILMGGTIAQGAYDAPAHYRKFDALILTDNWQDIINGGYVNADTQSPTVPTGLSATAISSSQINLSWTASTDNVAVSGYRVYRDNVEIATSTTTSYSNTGLSLSTTYSYTVSAYDVVGNNSAQSSSASATTQAGGGGSGGGNSSGGDASASGGSGCGYIKGKGQKAKGEGVVLMILLIIMLSIIAIAKKAFKRRAASKTRSQLLNFKTGLIGLIVLLLIAAYTPAHATVYFYYDAENETVGSNVPREPNGIDICTQGCTSVGNDATVQSAGGAPQGSKYFQWVTVDNQPSVYTEVVNHTTFPISLSLGTTYYLAYFFNFTRINGLDIWHETGQSADKGVEISGSGIRWIISRGNWSCIADTQDHYYTVWTGNPTYVLNPSPIPNCVDNIFGGNQNGYSASNPIQLQYERWYSAVMAVKIASNNTGSVAFWIDGVKIGEYNNIITSANNSPTINYITMGGTIAQGAYDAPAHYRKFDALMLTDNWQDIINGGYVNADTQSPTVPTGLSATAISSSQINLSWTASTDNVAVSGYRIYRDNVEIATSTTTSYSNTGLSLSTTYSYTVSAYDGAGNNSTQSSPASATTSGGSGGNNSGGDSSASGGSGCGFVKDDGKGQGAKGEGVVLLIMLIVILEGVALAKRIFSLKELILYKYISVFLTIFFCNIIK